MPTSIGKATELVTFTRTSFATTHDLNGLIKWAPHNLFLNSATPATQNVSTIVGARYTVEMTGTGTIALSNAATGNVTAGNTVNVIANTTSLQLTVSGSASAVWMYRSDLDMVRNANNSTYNPTSNSIYQGPRLDFTANGMPMGLLVEGPRTNVILYSNDLTNAVWGKGSVTTSRTAVGPDGRANSATIVTSTAANAVIGQTCIVASSARFTSAYLRRISGNGIIQMAQNYGISANATWSSANDTYSQTLPNATWTTINVSSEWVRYEIPTMTMADPTVAFLLAEQNNSIAIWGVQNENGTFRTSLIPTLANSATRNVDTTLVGTNVFPYSNTQGSLIVSFVPRNVSANIRAVQLDDGTANNRITLGLNGMPLGLLTVVESGNTQSTIGDGLPVANTIVKLAARYAANNFALSINGGTTQSGDFENAIYWDANTDTYVLNDYDGNVPTANTFRIGSGAPNIEPVNGWIRQVVYIPRALSDAELQQRSS